jgi:hypothetical protein
MIIFHPLLFVRTGFFEFVGNGDRKKQRLMLMTNIRVAGK